MAPNKRQPSRDEINSPNKRISLSNDVDDISEVSIAEGEESDSDEELIDAENCNKSFGSEINNELPYEFVQNKSISSVLYNNISMVVQGAKNNQSVKMIKLISSSSEEKENLTIKDLESLIKTVLTTVESINSQDNLYVKEKIKRRLVDCKALIESIIPKKEISHFQIFGYPDLLRDVFVKNHSIRLYPSRKKKDDLEQSKVYEEHFLLSKVNQHYSNTIIQTSINGNDIPNVEKLGSLNNFSPYTATLNAGIPFSIFFDPITDEKNKNKSIVKSHAWSALLQLCHQILYFGDFCNFNHKDLHDGNVVVSETPTNFVLGITARNAGGIPYPKCNVTFINCYKITIIDYAVTEQLPNNGFKSAVFPFKEKFFIELIGMFSNLIKLENICGIHSFFALASLGIQEHKEKYVKNKFQSSEIIVDQLNFSNSSLSDRMFISKLQEKALDPQDFKHYAYTEVNNSLLVDRQLVPIPQIGPPGQLNFNQISYSYGVPSFSSPPKFTKTIWPPLFSLKMQKSINHYAFKIIDKVSSTSEFMVTEFHILALYIKYSTLSSLILKFIESNNPSPIYIKGNTLFNTHRPKTPEKDSLFLSLRKFLAQYTFKINQSTIGTIRKSLKEDCDFENIEVPIQIQPPLHNVPQDRSIHFIKKQGFDIFGLVYDDLDGDLYCSVSPTNPETIGIFCRKKIIKNTIITQYYNLLNGNYPSIKVQHKPLPVQFTGCGNLMLVSTKNSNSRIIDEEELGDLFNMLPTPSIMIKSKTKFLPARFVISNCDIEPNQEIIIDK